MELNDWGLLFDEVLFLVIAVFLTLKGLMLRRRTVLGRTLARNNFAMALAYFGALLALHFEPFRSQQWRWSVRVLVALTAGHAIWSLLGYYGGWRGLSREMWLTVLEFRDAWREWAGMLRWRIRRVWRAVREPSHRDEGR